MCRTASSSASERRRGSAALDCCSAKDHHDLQRPSDRHMSEHPYRGSESCGSPEARNKACSEAVDSVNRRKRLHREDFITSKKPAFAEPASNAEDPAYNRVTCRRSVSALVAQANREPEACLTWHGSSSSFARSKLPVEESFGFRIDEQSRWPWPAPFVREEIR
jgi:hypothetical protein